MNHPTDSSSCDDPRFEDGKGSPLVKPGDDHLECIGYRDSMCKRVLYYSLCAISLGFVLLLVHWKPALYLYLTKRKCPLGLADCILIKDCHGRVYTEPVQFLEIADDGSLPHVVTSDYQLTVKEAILLMKHEYQYYQHPREILAINTDIQAANTIDLDVTSYLLSDDDRSGGADKEGGQPQVASRSPEFGFNAFATGPHVFCDVWRLNTAVVDCHTNFNENSSLLPNKNIKQKTDICQVKYFDHHQGRYMWDSNQEAFTKLHGLDKDVLCSAFHDGYHGLPADKQYLRLQVYGENAIDVPVKSYFGLLIEEVLNPFYIFQVMSIMLWALDDYYYYAGCIVVLCALSIGISLYVTRKQSEKLHDMAKSGYTEMSVNRGNNVYENVNTRHLVPGDLIAIPPHGCIMLCDAVLTAGTCIVNESMLTGESVPVTKTPLSHDEDSEIYSPLEHKRHTLFAGTQIIQTRYYGHFKVTAVVVRTGFQTSKGDLIRSILYPKPLSFKFYQDSIRFILFLSVIAILGMIYSVTTLILLKIHSKEIILRALDIITVCVPPALPAAMTVGTMYAQSRLKKQGIYCISPPRINYCGKVKLVCFDKTGTLTEDGLDLWGAVPVTGQSFLPVVNNTQTLPLGPFVNCMATCHSLTLINGELAGDPLDLKMFSALNWVLDEPGQDTSKFDSIMPTIVKPCSRESFMLDVMFPEQPSLMTIPYEVGIIRQFTFSSSFQRMAVITRVLGSDHMDAYVKGSPEIISSLCRPETVPLDFIEVLHRFTIQGLRVIALAWRPLDPKLSWHQAQRISREKIEKDLIFLGLLVMENMLKKQTTPVIGSLKKANIRPVMVTGDNILTAISVARNCGMVDAENHVIVVKATPASEHTSACINFELMENVVGNDLDPDLSMQPYFSMQMDPSQYHFAVSGKAFAVVLTSFPDLIEKLCVRGTVFARMAPDQKAQLVEQLQKLGYIVAMCGDGANDCEALKAAHAGISLSEAEASVAAPFTSNMNNIECVPTLIREGRAALVTSFGTFKYMALYSMIQFCTVGILYQFGTNLSDFMFLYVDLFVTAIVAILMGYTGAYHSLVAKRPPGSLMKPTNLLSILIHVLIVIAFQLVALFLLKSQSWYEVCKMTLDANNYRCQETTTLFYISAFQYIIMAVCFSKGPPYRKRIWTNILYFISLVILTAFTVHLLFWPLKPFKDILKLAEMTRLSFKLTLLGMAIGNFFIALIIEHIITESNFCQSCLRILRGKKHPRNRYKLIEQELLTLPEWPPLGNTSSASIQGQ